MVSIDMMQRIKGGGVPAEQYPIRTLARSFGHVGESKGDLLLIDVIDGFVNEEIKLHGMQPMHGLVIGSIEHFRDADA